MRQSRLIDAEQPHRAHAAAQQAPQHVPAALIGRADAVADEHQAGAHVVGHDSHADVVQVVRPVALAGDLLRSSDDGEHLVDLVHVVDALQQVRHALEAHARVDVALLQPARDPELVLRPDVVDRVLHEDQVPDLQVAVLIHDRPAVRTVLRATVDVDLRARARRTRLTRVPVVVLLATALDALVGQAGDLAPDPGRLVVLVVHGHPDLVRVKTVAAVRRSARHELPGVLDRALLEVVPEREVPVHLEERAVPGRLADLFDVLRPHALLHARGPRPGRRLLAEHVRDERDHARDREQRRRIRGDQ